MAPPVGEVEMARRQAGAILGAGVIALALFAAAAVAAAAPRRVLILHSFGRQFEPYRSAASAFRTELASRSPDPVEFYEVALETARFAEGAVDEPLADYLRASYAAQPPDLVVSIAAPAARFWARHRERVLPGVPFLAAAVEERHVDAIDLGAGATAVTFRVDDAAFVEEVLRLLPDTERIAVVYGASPLEKFWVSEIRRAWQPFDGRVEIVWLDELPFPDAVKRAASLPPRSVVVFGTMSVDAAGVPHEEHAALERLRAEANAPIFGFFDAQLGRGVVGGRAIATRELGTESARTALRILGGESPETIPAAIVPPTAPEFDARELERWSVPEGRLPAGSEVRFREPSLWDVQRTRIVAVAMFVALQTILIVVLLRSRQRLRSARAKLGENERNLRELSRELSHAGRVSLLGQVTASLAHELGQPLGAILRNSDAAELLLKNDRLDLDELSAILADVRRDGHRAGAVVARLRALLERRNVEMQTMAWSEVVGEVLDIVRGDAQAREIVLERDVPPDLPPARGDRVHLQQVLLNLVANAMDALDGNGTSERRVTVRARRGGDGWIESEVHDTGRGIPADRLATAFDPFVTSKPDGMGMGLPISRSIVEAHGGRIWAENDAGGGTTFRFTVPSGAEEDR
jgi:signal transduction histidine kinase